MPPPGGRTRTLGTNPFCFAAPTGGEHPIVFDMATTAIAGFKVRVAALEGRTLSEGLVADASGQPTTDPTEFLRGGLLLPVGGHKGFGMAVACELLGGALAGGLTQRDGDASRRRVLNGMLDRLERSFLQANRFAADASHELRTPLTLMAAELEDILGRSDTSDESRHLAEQLLEEVRRLARIVGGLLVLSRLDARESLSAPVQFDLVHLVRDTVDQMTVLASEKQQSLDFTSTGRVKFRKVFTTRSSREISLAITSTSADSALALIVLEA